jgi:hypothetical protein
VVVTIFAFPADARKGMAEEKRCLISPARQSVKNSLFAIPAEFIPLLSLLTDSTAPTDR